MRISRVVLGIAAAVVAFPAASQDGCKVGAQSASAAAQEYRLAVGKVRTNCTRGTSDCDQLRFEADQLLEALTTANEVMQEACTPGSGGGTTPGPGELVITEVMVDPVAVSDDYGEWIEMYNPTTRALDLKNLTLATEYTVTPSTSHTISTSVVVPAGGYVVLGRSSDLTLNGGVLVSYAYSGLDLPNQYLTGNYELRILNGATVIDSVPITDRVAHVVGPTEPWIPGFSRSLSSNLDASANDNAIDWCMPGVTYGAGDYGTPGYSNGMTCVAL